MSVEAWLAFCATETVLCLIPGPAVLFVVSVALARGPRPGVAASLGVLAANLAYFALSATGIAAVVVASHDLFRVLKWTGAVYLVCLGLGMLVGRSRSAAAASPQLVRRALLRGVLVQGANPKALVFFVALLPQFIDAGAPIAFQIIVLGASSVVIEFFVLGVYVALAVRAREVAGSRLAAPLQRVGGGFLVAAGARLAVVQETR
jgi:threonine/homoserine/homoserine lactone efflux protein